jgi:(p)ppGpp synthase/HD superfamily hydrolase
MGVVTRIPIQAPGLPHTRAALEYARKRHLGQTREIDGAPFIEHPREVAALLYGDGAQDDLVAAGALHDVLEKTPATAFDLRRRFGSTVAALVLAVTEDAGISDVADRKRALRNQVAGAGEEALRLFAADKIAKVRELQLQRVVTSRRARRAWTRHLAHYKLSLALLEERIPDSPLVRQLASELAGLRRPASRRWWHQLASER